MKSKQNPLITITVFIMTLLLESGCHSVSSPPDSQIKTAATEKTSTPPKAVEVAEPVKTAPTEAEKTATPSPSAKPVEPAPAEKIQVSQPPASQPPAGKFIPVVQSVPTGLAVNAIAYSRDGRLLAITYEDNVIRLFKVVKNRFDLLRVFVGHTDEVTSLDFDPQGQHLTSHSEDGTMKSWELKTGKLLSDLEEEVEEEVNSFPDGIPLVVAVDPRGRYKAIGNSPGTIELVKINSGKKLFSLKVYDENCEAESNLKFCNQDVGFLIFDPQGKLLVSAGGNNQPVIFWEIPSGKRLFTLTGQERPISAIAFDTQRLRLASGSDYFYSSNFLADKTKVSSTLKVWELLSGNLLVLPDNYLIDSLSFDGQGQHLAGKCDFCRVRVWEVPSKRLLLELSYRVTGSSPVAFDPQGKYLVTSSNGEDKFIAWEMPTEKQRLASTTISKGRAHDEDWLKSITFENPLKKQDEYDEDLGPVVFDPQGRYLVGGMMIWEVSSKQLVHTLPKGIGSVAFDQKGKLMVGAVDEAINLWEVGSWKLLRTLKADEQEIWSVVIDSPGKRIASSDGGIVRLWDATNGSLLTTFQHVGQVASIAFTRHGQYLAVTGSEGYIAFYEVMTGQRFLSLHSLDNGGKLILLADGRFDGDEKGMEYLRYTERGTLNSYSAKELKAQFFQPAAVKEALRKVGGK